jgi:hypothetical protein
MFPGKLAPQRLKPNSVSRFYAGLKCVQENLSEDAARCRRVVSSANLQAAPSLCVGRFAGLPIDVV